MRLLLIVDDYLPHGKKSTPKMVHDLAVQLYKNGHSVSVLTPLPNIKKNFAINILDKVTVISFKSGELKNASNIKRAINETLLSHKGWSNAKKYLESNYFDGIIYYSPSIFFGPLVSKLKKKWNCKSYLILRDIFPQWAVDNGLMKNRSLIYYYFNFFEKLSYKAADRIGVMSNSNIKYFRNRFKSINKFEVLFNWSSISKVPKVKTKYRDKLSLKEKIVFFYGGMMGYAQQMMNLVELAKKLQNRNDVHFVFVGNGDEVDMIIKEIQNNNLSNITYLPPVSQAEYLEMLNEFDIGLFSLHPSHKTHNFPGKLLGYMDYEKPILGCVNQGNDLKDIVNENKAGFVFQTGNIEGMLSRAVDLINDKKLRVLMGRNGKKLLKDKFSALSASQKIENFLKK